MKNSPASQLFALFPLFLFIFMLWRLIWNKVINPKKPTLNLPPGPPKLPIIGNMHQLIGSMSHHKFYSLAKEYGPIFYLKLGEVDNIVISSPETAKQIMKTHDLTFASRPHLYAVSVVAYNCTDIAFSPYGEYWRQLRKICILELLSAKRVQSYRHIREEEMSKFVGHISSMSGSVINLSKLIFSLTYTFTSKAAFGKACREQETFIRLGSEVIEAAGGFSVADFFPSVKWLDVLSGMRSKLVRLHMESDRILDIVIEEHKARRVNDDGDGHHREAEDLVDVLLNLNEKDNVEFTLTTENIKAVIIDMFIAGSEAPGTTVEWAISHLIKDPNTMKKAQEEVRMVFGEKGRVDEAGLNQLSYLKMVIKETLRLHPPVAMLLPRECRENCQINGYDIPVKSRVIVNAWAIGRDPKYWTEPEKFYPERFLDSSYDFTGTKFEYVPFGAGRRMCPGIAFGVAGLELTLASLLFHFDWKLAGGLMDEDLDLDEHFGSTVRRETDLNVIPIVYNPTVVA